MAQQWYEATVAGAQLVAGEMNILTLDVGPAGLAPLHRQPGQYLKVALDGAGEGIFAIASVPHPGSSFFELLVKRGSGLADALRALPVGAKVKISEPLGAGFPLDRARGRDLLLFATGSGISAIRPVVEAIRRERTTFGRVTLFFGARTPEDFAFAHQLESWQTDGVQVVRTVSRPGASGWQGLTGYVQSHIGGERLEGNVAFLSGHGSMVEEVTRALRERGVALEDIFLNY